MIEIERKFIVDTKKWQAQNSGTSIIQGYISGNNDNTVRIRITDSKSVLTIKGPTSGISRAEFEFEIPEKEAHEMMNLCIFPPILKTRYTQIYARKLWEIDVFEGENTGLVLAEIELISENERIELPDWILTEVSGDYRYYNSWLARNPFSNWEH